MSIDKSKLYGCFQKSWQRRDRLNELATRKALDLPLEDDELQITNTHVGLNWPHLLTAGLLMLLSAGATAGGILAVAPLLGQPAVPVKDSTVMTPSEVTQQDLAAQEYEVFFWTEDGREIPVGHTSPQRQQGTRGSE
jgi:hypothetical protein